MSEYTTPEQFIVNFLIIPIVLPWYNYITDTILMRILFTSILFWTIQIIQGYFLIFLFGYNRAWQYFGISAFFHGNIRINDCAALTCLGGVTFYLLSDIIDQMIIIGK